MTKHPLCVHLFLCICVFGSAGYADTANPYVYSWDMEHEGASLDLSGYVLTFSDEFDASDITDEAGAGKWMAPVHSDVGASTWDKPSAQNGTYTVKDGVLTIRATRASDGKWHSGNIQTMDSHGKGFAQKYGYFEVRAKFPVVPGAWCAFWLKSQTEHLDNSIVRPEIDVFEWYGGDPKGHHETVHLWPPPQQFIKAGMVPKHWYKSNYTGLPQLASGWHTHGVLITPDSVVMYVDRKEVARFPTLDEYKLPLYPLVSLTLYDKDLAKATSPIDFQVDYVHIYALRVPGPPADVRVE
jgi:beta-glucanase (GH16 family)